MSTFFCPKRWLTILPIKIAIQNSSKSIILSNRNNRIRIIQRCEVCLLLTSKGNISLIRGQPLWFLGSQSHVWCCRCFNSPEYFVCLITNVYDSLGFRDSREGLQRELRRISSPQLKGLEQEQGPVWANSTNQGPKAESQLYQLNK